MRAIQFAIFALLISFVSSTNAAVLIPEKRWPQNATLNVWFLDGSPSKHKFVEHTAVRWSQFSNVSFQFFGPKAAPSQTHVRVSFTGYDGTMLGNHGDYTGTKPTMRLASIVRDHVSNASKKRIILHEFGHVLGLEHEFIHPHWPYGSNWHHHQQKTCETRLSDVLPAATISEDCYRLNTPLSETNVWWFPFDEKSIMMYPIESQWLNHRNDPIEEPLSLSTIDKMAIHLSYPKTDLKKISQEEVGHSLKIDNRCNQSLSLSLLDKQLPPLIMDLRPFERSERIRLSSSEALFTIKPENDTYQWPNGALSLDLTHSEVTSPTIPLFCR